MAVVSAACWADRPADARRPSNVLIVTVDTLRADHLGVYGYPEPTSPNIDRLASRGVVYERAIAASSRTAPSHASIFTSRYVRDHAVGHVNGASRLGDEQTLAAVLASRGYATAAFVSNAVLSRRTGLSAGFAHYDDDLRESESNRGWMFERRAPATTERALAWLAGASDPWLLWVHYNDPHGPYDPPPSHGRVPSLSGVAPAGLASARFDRALPVLQDQSGRGGIPAYQVLGELRRTRDYRTRYAAEIHFLDESFGRLLDAAERASGGRDLVVLLTADHGESLGEEGVFFAHGHGTAPDLARVPLIVRAPDLPPGRSRDLVHHVDVVPTLLELLEVPPLAGVAGLPLARYWRERSALPDRVVYTDIGNEISAYTRDRFERLRISEYEQRSDIYRWTVEGGWKPADAAVGLHESLGRYAARRAPLVPAAELDAAEREQLRALGYLPPLSPDEVAGAETTRGVAAERSGDHAGAIAHYRAALRAQPHFLEAANNLAWLLATTPDPALRDAEAALELARLAVARDPQNPAVLDTLAASYAAAGHFSDAVREQSRALAALTSPDPALRGAFRARLAAYQERAKEAGHAPE